MKLNPFMPGRTIDPQFFAGRESEIKKFKMFYRNVKQGNSLHFAVQGDRGIGKTSLIRYLESLAKADKAIVVRLDMDASFDSLNAFAKALLSKIRKEGQRYSQLFKVSDTFGKLFQDRSVSLDLFGASIELSKKEQIQSFELQDKLSEIWLKMAKHVPAVVIMIDEAEYLEKVEGAFQYIRNVFARLAEENYCYMLVISGKLTLFRKIKEIHSPLARFFNPVELGSFNEKESKEAILKPLHGSEFEMSNAVINKIIEESEGHPYIIQVYGFYLCENSPKKNIDISVFNANYPIILDSLSQQLFSDYYHLASNAEKNILKLVANDDKNTIQIVDVAKKMGKTTSGISYLFERLVEKNSLIKTSRGRYSLFHGLFKQYLKTV